jgi:hypothetical protein
VTGGRGQMPGRATTAPPRGPGRAVDSPAFWWSAAAVFLVNAALTAGEGRWLIGLLQILTATWAAVAGVTAARGGTSGAGRPD